MSRSLLVLTAGVLVATLGLAPRVLVAQSSSARPRLLVIVTVDQMRSDYIERYGHQWTAGLRRLLSEGARYRQAAYPYMNTVTCAGHTTIGTGSFPATHGMVLNQWWDRTLGRIVACTDDESMPIVGHDGEGKGGHSAARILVPTLADELRLQLPVQPKVVAMSMKPRSSIPLAGHRGDLVLWFESDTGWTTSKAYAAGPIPLVTRFTAEHPIKVAGTSWTRLLPESAYLFEDNGVGERPGHGWTAGFPHVFPAETASRAQQYAAWEESPLSNDTLATLAETVIKEMKLGAGPGTDFLAVSFSALDFVGHAFGPRSHEVQDVLARLDVAFGKLLAALDGAVGPDNYVLAFTGDHGVSPIPEQATSLGFDAGRVNLRAVVDSVEAVLAKRWGPGKYVASVAYTDFYFNTGVFDRLRKEPETLRSVIDVIAASPGVARVIRSDDLVEGRVTADASTRTLMLSYRPERSGDLLIVPRPNWISAPTGATHGTLYAYDQRVPVIIRGRGVVPGEYLASATPADIAPTLAWFAGITLPRADGRILSEALAQRQPKD